MYLKEMCYASVISILQCDGAIFRVQQKVLIANKNTQHLLNLQSFIIYFNYRPTHKYEAAYFVLYLTYFL